MSPYLEKRGPVYYFRVRVPDDLLHLFPGKQIRISLKTKRSDSAGRLVKEWEERADRIFTRLRANGLHERDIKELVGQLCPSQRKREEKRERMTLGKMCDIFLSQYKTSNEEKTLQEKGLSLSFAKKFFGEDIPIEHIHNEDCQKFREFLLKLRKQNRLDCDFISPVTARKHLGTVNSVFIMATTSRYINMNPMTGVKIEIKKNGEPPRIPYTDHELQSTINILELPGTEGWKPSRYWVPLISMFSGMRLGEICQLYEFDFVRKNGVDCISIDTNTPGIDIKMPDGSIKHIIDKRLKTPAARRHVPIHPFLIELGLLKYVESLPTKTRLFPELSWFRDGYGHSYKWFGPLNIQFRSDKRMTFHSLRHTVATLLMEEGAHSVHRADLLGHERGGNLETDRTYTHGTKESTLKGLVEQIQYPNVVFYRLTSRKPTFNSGMETRRLNLD
ncbi:MAG: site-specific integrase [Geobacter sp.]|nr:MAG: site-specific integrase [Geobacter sp.]